MVRTIPKIQKTIRIIDTKERVRKIISCDESKKF